MPGHEQGWEDMVLVGRIARPQGNRGETIVDADTDFPEERFAAGGQVFVRRNGAIEPLTIAEFRMHGPRPAVRFEGMASIEDAETLRGLEMRVPESTLAALPEGMWYHHELLGCRVRTKDGREVGTVTGIQGPTDRSILVIEGPDGPALVPLVAAFCAVDRAARVIEIDPPEGLLEVNRGNWRTGRDEDVDAD
ncbi:MAG: ribosome maturation factor RimM [Acidobacteriota bacterium]|nr:ribosome maturation factor RimM [Acidobacteriota bacterium]